MNKRLSTSILATALALTASAAASASPDAVGATPSAPAPVQPVPAATAVAESSTAAAQSASAGLEFDAGASLRLRQEVLQRIPGAVPCFSGYNNNFRALVNVWAKAGKESDYIYIRAADEFRFWAHPSRSTFYRFPDEVIIDNLYLNLEGLFGGRLDIRAGRQDFLGPDMYGAGLVILDGTPADGSRTTFFDAVRLRWAFTEKEKTDALFIYDNHKTAFSWGHPNAGRAERELATVWPGTSHQIESGGGLYHRSRSLDFLPFDAYWIYKRESKAAPAAGGRTAAGRKVHTFGARLMPKFTDTLSGAFEGAYQNGRRDGGAACSGAMLDASLRWSPDAGDTWKPWLQGEFYCLSGERNRRRDGGSDHSWDPLWSRWPQNSELLVLNFTNGVGYWTNLMFPSLSAGVSWNGRHDFSVRSGPMYAAVRDIDTAEGRYMGWFTSAKAGFTIVKGAFDGRGDITGYVLGELFNPGDYYNDGKPAWFLRWQLLFSF